MTHYQRFKKRILEGTNDMSAGLDINSSPLKALQLIRELERENKKLKEELEGVLRVVESQDRDMFFMCKQDMVERSLGELPKKE